MAYRIDIDRLRARDARIAELEARHDALTPAEADELIHLIDARDQCWRKLPARIARLQRAAADLSAYVAAC